MKTIIALLMLAGTMSGQKLKPDVQSVDNFIAIFDNPIAPKDAHEIALDWLRKYDDYMHGSADSSSHGLFTYAVSTNFIYVIRAGGLDGTEQSFSVNRDGKIELKNITMEDALLLLVGDSNRRALENAQNWDRDEEQREKERNTNPPIALKFDGRKFKVDSVSDIGANVLGQTNCKAATIKILMSDGAKRVGVLHEIMHVATNCDEKVHSAIYELQGPLLKMLQENPDMVDYLTNRKPIMTKKSNAVSAVPRKP